MRAIMVSGFSAVYLVLGTFLGVRILLRAKENREAKLFGVMALVLVFGDAFHLAPRIASAVFPEPDYTAALGFGTFVTSITMTVFYVMLYYVWRLRYDIAPDDKTADFVWVWFYAILRVLVCLAPQNQWLSPDAPAQMAWVRNFLFIGLGSIIIHLFHKKAKEKGDRAFKFMWLAILLSFFFYIPVVLWVDVYPLIGMLMLPKTCMYVWMLWMGNRAYAP